MSFDFLSFLFGNIRFQLYVQVHTIKKLKSTILPSLYSFYTTHLCNYSAYQNQSIDADLAEMDAWYCNLVKKEKRDQ